MGQDLGPIVDTGRGGTQALYREAKRLSLLVAFISGEMHYFPFIIVGCITKCKSAFLFM